MADNKWVKNLEEKVENKAKETVAKVKEEMVDFHTWFSARSAQIDKHHYKEIIMADMKARGVAMINTMAKFDEALEKYGIKLK